MDRQDMSLTGSYTFNELQDEMENGHATSNSLQPLRYPTRTKTRHPRRTNILLVVMLVLVVVIVVLAVLYGLEVSKSKRAISDDRNACYTPKCLSIASVILANMNLTRDPCEEFAKYTCELWDKNYPENYITDPLIRNNFNKLRALMEDRSDVLPPNDPRAIVKQYYQSCIDEKTVQENYIKDLTSFQAVAGDWPVLGGWNETKWNWMDAVIKLQRFSLEFSFLMKMELIVDPQDPSGHTFRITPPEISDDIKTKEAKLRELMDWCELIGARGAHVRTDMQKVMEFEKHVEQIIPEFRDIYKNWYNSHSVASLEAQSGFPWSEYLTKLVSITGKPLAKDRNLVVTSIPYFASLTKLINTTEKRTLANYLLIATIQTLKPLFSTSLGGKKVTMPRWERCLTVINERYGLKMAMGYLWVQKEFDKQDIPVLNEMWGDIKDAFRQRLDDLHWLDEETKQHVRDKVDIMKGKIGYPEVCNNLTLLKTYIKGMPLGDPDHLLLMDINVTSWGSSVVVKKFMLSAVTDEWVSAPYNVNAYYRMTRNEINVLGGMLQPPFFYGRKAPIAVNFGGIGSVLAHELIHGFDTWGRKFDKHGVMGRKWFSDSTVQQFNARSQCMVDQYSAISVLFPDNTSLSMVTSHFQKTSLTMLRLFSHTRVIKTG
ncbi:membrane metallo-endopeptidase-like 1 isoform X2 [Nematostella vectensis]|uniref:membrane metallo-endopeptidase-like 1 isoform X2 n=1 Tax=Nematostella vectensis TaxID=45351 RepID=UPI00138FABB4|nr:membrane metallo-endopeptidase-like 1 isoform X2 [Nematostella vectensis]